MICLAIVYMVISLIKARKARKSDYLLAFAKNA